MQAITQREVLDLLETIFTHPVEIKFFEPIEIGTKPQYRDYYDMEATGLVTKKNNYGNWKVFIVCTRNGRPNHLVNWSYLDFSSRKGILGRI